MANQIAFWSASLVTAILFVGPVLAEPGRQSLVSARVASPYRTYCAPCHGNSARGDGPLAASLRRRPSNLTETLQHDSGVFPRDKVFRTIDGRHMIVGHIGPDMPLWADAFRQSAEAGDADTVVERFQAIVDFLESVSGPQRGERTVRER